MLKIEVIGNLGKDCIEREVNGQFVMNFSVAHNERYVTKDGEEKEKCMWINCSVWREKMSKLSEHLLKGQLVFVSGSLNPKLYTGDDGQTRIDLKMNVDYLELLGPSIKKQREEGQEMPKEAIPSPEPESDDDIPF